LCQAVRFLTEEIRSSLNWQFDRLSESEKEVIKAVAIEQIPVNMYQLIQSIEISPSDISNAILSLGRRGLIDRLKTDDSILFSMKPIVRQLMLLSR
jgi:predicted transcriptional regulator